MARNARIQHAVGPAQKGKIERFFRTCGAQLITQLIEQDTASLEDINRRLATWVEGEYHHSSQLSALSPQPSALTFLDEH